MDHEIEVFEFLLMAVFVFHTLPNYAFCESLLQQNRLSQTSGTLCAINSDILPHISCKRLWDGGPCRRCEPHIDWTFTTTQQTRSVGPTADHTHSGSGKNCKTNVCREKDAQSGVSRSLAIGLFFLGILIGAIVSTIICFCVPSLRRITKMGIRDRETINNSARDQGPQPAAAETLPVQVSMIETDRTVPTANVVESNPVRYLALTNARDRHSYTGLQIPVYFEPLEDDFTHQDSNTQPIRGHGSNTQPITGQRTVNNRTVPTAHGVESNPARYLALANATDSHSYTGLQIPVYFEPLGDDFTHHDFNTHPIIVQDSNAQPIRGEDSNTQPIRGQNSNTKQIKGHDSNMQPIRGQDSNTKPIRGHDSNMQQIRGQDSNTMPIRGQDSNTQLIRGQDSNTQPIRAHNFHTQRIRGLDSNTQPIRGQDSNTQLIRGQNCNSKPVIGKKPVFVISVPNQEMRKQIVKENSEKQQYKWNSQS